MRACVCVCLQLCSEWALTSVKVGNDKVNFHVLDNVQVEKQSHTWSVKTASIVKHSPTHWIWRLFLDGPYECTKSIDSTEFHGARHLKCIRFALNQRLPPPAPMWVCESVLQLSPFSLDTYHLHVLATFIQWRKKRLDQRNFSFGFWILTLDQLLVIRFGLATEFIPTAINPKGTTISNKVISLSV